MARCRHNPPGHGRSRRMRRRDESASSPPHSSPASPKTPARGPSDFRHGLLTLKVVFPIFEPSGGAISLGSPSSTPTRTDRLRWRSRPPMARAPPQGACGSLPVTSAILSAVELNTGFTVRHIGSERLYRIRRSQPVPGSESRRQHRSRQSRWDPCRSTRTDFALAAGARPEANR